MYEIVLTVDVIVALTIVALVLLQQGKGANTGVAFGNGASNTMFGSKGSAPFLFKATAICTAIFFLCSLSLGYMGKSSSIDKTVSAQKIASQYDYQKYQKEVNNTTSIESTKTKEDKSK